MIVDSTHSVDGHCCLYKDYINTKYQYNHKIELDNEAKLAINGLMALKDNDVIDYINYQLKSGRKIT